MNMHKRIGWAAILLAFMLAACGGDGPGLAGGRNGPGTGGDPGGDPPGGENPGGENPDPTVNVSSIELLASSTQMLSDGSNPITLTAVAKDANNRALADVPIDFRASSGTLQGAQDAVTDEQGAATATLVTGIDRANRAITVTASVGGISDDLEIQVTGSSINIQGPNSLVNGTKGRYTVILEDAAGKPISEHPVEFDSANGNAVTALTADTDSNGRAVFEVEAGASSGTDTLTATALPDSAGVPSVSAGIQVKVSADNFRFISPDEATEIPLRQPESVVIHWDKNGTPQTGKTIRFATTRGTVSATQETTDANGDASIDIQATTAGPAVITATTEDGISAELPVEFVATDADQIFLQTEPGIIGPAETSTITAVVLDAENNRVKNKRVNFTLKDASGGRLSVGSAITDSLGRAQTVYTASNASGGFDGVKVTGTLEESPTVQGETALTVAGRPLFIRFGTGNTIEEDDADTTYTKRYSLFVTDAAGAGVANASVNLSIKSTAYFKGHLVPGLEVWEYDTTIVPDDPYPYPPSPLKCDREDVNIDGDGVLDEFEDTNGDGVITPGNVAVIMPGKVVTDESGRAYFEVVYPQNYAWWVEAEITAIAAVSGTESRAFERFDFPASGDDMKIDGTPPNAVSPFGVDTNTCMNAD